MFRIFFEHVLSQRCITSGGSVAPPQKYVRLPCCYHMVLNWKIHRCVGLCFQVAWQPIKPFNTVFYTTHTSQKTATFRIYFRTCTVTEMRDKWWQCGSTSEVRMTTMLYHTVLNWKVHRWICFKWHDNQLNFFILYFILAVRLHWLRAGRPGDRGSIPGGGKGFFL
jgi:hypothetical protein